ncbi:hypothetical protein HYT45_03045 [Candidatus Uhrbacteria bacterium]|nr:hypothetical protein [Candidatus Uhrbacteria bacterium]
MTHIASPFGSIIGHERVLSYLERSAAVGRIAQAYIFEGAEHLGKRTVADIFAAMLLGMPPDKLRSYPDFFLLERGAKDKNGKVKKNIGIDEARELIHRLYLSSAAGSRKIAVIDNAETLSTEAANALLKTLEEPQGRVCVILVASGIDLLPKTIISRAEVLCFAPVAASKIEKSLIEQGVKQELAAEISKLAFGAPGIALKLSGESVNMASYKEEVSRDLRMFSAPLVARFKFVEKILPAKADDLRDRANRFLDRFEIVLRDLLYLSLGSREEVAHAFALSALSGAAAGASSRRIGEKIKNIAGAREEININISPRVVLENFFLKL